MGLQRWLLRLSSVRKWPGDSTLSMQYSAEVPEPSCSVRPSPPARISTRTRVPWQSSLDSICVWPRTLGTRRRGRPAAHISFHGRYPIRSARRPREHRGLRPGGHHRVARRRPSVEMDDHRRDAGFAVDAEPGNTDDTRRCCPNKCLNLFVEEGTRTALVSNQDVADNSYENGIRHGLEKLAGSASGEPITKQQTCREPFCIYCPRPT